MRLLQARYMLLSNIHCDAGHYCNRIHVTAAGCLLWGIMTAGFGFCSSVSEGLFFWGMNGIGKIHLPTGSRPLRRPFTCV